MSWSHSVKRGYDRAGQVTWGTNRRSEGVGFTYDALGRLTSKSGANLSSVTYSYSPDGRRAVGSSAVSVDSLFLSIAGRPDSVVTRMANQRFRVAYRHDPVKRIDSILVASSTAIAFVNRGYYATTGRFDSLRVNANQIAFTYDGEGQRTKTVWAGGVDRREFYNTNHERYRTSFPSHGTVDAALWRNYAYDKLGRLEHEERKYGSYLKFRDFAYDSVGRLRREDRARTEGEVVCPEPTGTEIIADGSDCTQTVTTVEEARLRFSYDASGNLTEEANLTSGGVTAAGYGGANRLLTWGGLTYEHDLDGNRTRMYGGGTDTHYTWDAEGKLIRVESGTRVIEYDYNAFGQLVRRRVDGVVDRHFLWEGVHLLAELDGAATARVAEYVYYPGVDRPAAIVTGATSIAAVRYFQQDELGNVAGVFTSTGGLDQALRYTARGLIADSSGTLGAVNRLRWKGLLWEGDSTRLYYVRNRWYDPHTGRFLTEDPIGIAGGMNLYVFGGNDQINTADPFGLACELLNGAIAPEGFSFSVGYKVNQVCRNGRWKFEWEDIVVTAPWNNRGPGAYPPRGPGSLPGNDGTGLVGTSTAGVPPSFFAGVLRFSASECGGAVAGAILAGTSDALVLAGGVGALRYGVLAARQARLARGFTPDAVQGMGHRAGAMLRTGQATSAASGAGLAYWFDLGAGGYGGAPTVMGAEWYNFVPVLNFISAASDAWQACRD